MFEKEQVYHDIFVTIFRLFLQESKSGPYIQLYQFRDMPGLFRYDSKVYDFKPWTPNAKLLENLESFVKAVKDLRVNVYASRNHTIVQATNEEGPTVFVWTDEWTSVFEGTSTVSRIRFEICEDIFDEPLLLHALYRAVYANGGHGNPRTDACFYISDAPRIH